MSSPARAQLKELETKDLRLIYFDPALTYVTPHAGRCFENALGFHRKLFSYTPSGPVTVLLDDFADSGNAAATAVPRNFVKVDMAPLSFAFETVVANERINWLMNHELVHVTAVDQAAGSERFFRGLFRGKVSAVPEQPESILYFYLTSPRAAAPRWYQEGLAVFVETWMAGGQGRAQGAYDEMVFRSMVKDDQRFYDPLGLVSEGVKVDFQTEVNSYLYGTRFLSYLAYERSPEQVIEWARRGKGTKAYYASQFKKVFGRSLGDAWRDWTAWEHDFQQRNLDAVRSYPLTPHTDISTQGLGSVSRAYYDADKKALYAGLNYPGIVSHIGAISTEDGRVRKIQDIKGPRIYTVTSLAWDPGTRTLFYTSDNNALRDLLSVSPDTGETRLLLKDARIGELVYSPAEKALFGIRTLNGLATLVRVAPPYKEWQSLYTWPYGEVAYDLDLSADASLVSFSHGDASGRQSLRIVKLETLRKGDATAVAQFDFGAAIPSNFVFTPDGKYLYGSSYYTGVSNIFRYDLASGKLDAVSNTETGFFRPIPLGDGRARRLPLHRQGLRARAHPRGAARGRQGDHVPRRPDRREARDREAVEARLAQRRAARVAHDGPGPLQLGPEHPPRVDLSRRPGLQGVRGGRPARELLGPAVPEPREPHRVVHARQRPARERALPRRRASFSATTGRSASR